MNSEKLNIIVTGGAGIIGSHLIDRMLAEGHAVTNIDNFDSFYDESIKRDNVNGDLKYDTYALHEVDIRDKEALDKAIPDDTNVIVHLAANAGPRPSIDDPIAYQEVNVAGTQNILEVAREKEIKQNIFTSYGLIFSETPNVPWKGNDVGFQPNLSYTNTKDSKELLGYVLAVCTINKIKSKLNNLFGFD